MRLAIDCDLFRLHAVGEDGTVFAKNIDPLSTAPEAEDFFLALDLTEDPVLFEIAGALDYTDNKAVAHNKRRWTIYNVAVAAALAARRALMGRLLVAPSSVWTRRHDLATRHALAGCKHKQKDLRECEAMLWFHSRHPEDWVPLPEYLAAL